MAIRRTHARTLTFWMGALALLLNFTLVPEVWAQAASTNSSGGVMDDSLDDLALIGGLGIGGAILGLSTLSFAEEPGDHIKNIYIGAAVGIIVGVGVVAWQQATKSQEMFEADRQAWLKDVAPAKNSFFSSALNNKAGIPLSFAYSFKF